MKKPTKFLCIKSVKGGKGSGRLEEHYSGKWTKKGSYFTKGIDGEHYWYLGKNFYSVGKLENLLKDSEHFKPIYK